MRRLFLTCAILLSALPVWANDDNDHGPDPAIAAEMGYRRMENGAIIYEEVIPGQPAQGQDIPLEDIAPAAGPAKVPEPAPVVHYDPLTQTYRRVTVDKDGNTRHDVINTSR